MVIDMHSHIVPRRIAQLGEEELEWHGIKVQAHPQGGLRFEVGDNKGRLPWKNFRQTIEERVAALDEMGVDKQLVSLSPALWQFRSDVATARAGAREFNNDLADICRREPARFGGLAWLPLQDTDAAVTELARAVGELGLAGAAVATHVNGENWDNARLFPIMQAAAQLNAVVFIHPAQVRVRQIVPNFYLTNVIGNPWEVTAAAASLVFGGVLDRLPNLKVILAHGGGYTAMAMGRMDHAYGARPESGAHISALPSEYLRRFYYDTVTHSAGALRFLVESVGAEQVVLGSDYPADMAFNDPVATIRTMEGLSDTTKELVLGQTMAALLARN